MPEQSTKTAILQEKSHEALMKLLNNIGVVGSILAAIADILFVVIMVVGVKVEINSPAIVIFAVVNAFIGLLINNLLRYQGKHYAELENDELCKAFYQKQIKEKRYVPTNKWMVYRGLTDILVKGCTTAGSIAGILYITIAGTHNPIQILITAVNIVLFACFGLISMNSAYNRFYNTDVPYMKEKIKERTKHENRKSISRDSEVGTSDN